MDGAVWGLLRVTALSKMEDRAADEGAGGDRGQGYLSLS